ncbi:NUDIX domain-containing protein [Flavobacteriaceae bacterium F08102]|nr:NUDIX domain-containing protein [Flavobacteriaceae bacterium F08102]
MNPRVKNIQTKNLSDDWYILNKVNFDYKMSDGLWINQNREVYNKGNGAAILLYNKNDRKVILTKQFRMPTYLNGHKDGMMIEVPAGLLDGDLPEKCIKKETLEETGYVIEEVKKIMELYSSPGAVSEKITYFIAAYTPQMKQTKGGGIEDEAEDIEVLEVDFDIAIEMIYSGKITDVKTVVLLQYALIQKLF